MIVVDPQWCSGCVADTDEVVVADVERALSIGAPVHLNRSHSLTRTAVRDVENVALPTNGSRTCHFRRKFARHFHRKRAVELEVLGIIEFLFSLRKRHRFLLRVAWPTQL